GPSAVGRHGPCPARRDPERPRPQGLRRLRDGVGPVRLQRLQVDRFRGIHHLDWWPSHQMVCLVGPGDSTKTTILAAIEWVLSPRWQLTPTDSDFFQLDTTEPIVITATVTDLSD